MNIPVDQFCANMLGIYVNLFFIIMPHVTRVTWNNALKTDIFLNSLGPRDAFLRHDFPLSPPERRIFAAQITARSSRATRICVAREQRLFAERRIYAALTCSRKRSQLISTILCTSAKTIYNTTSHWRRFYES